jgi:predicted negative regulator of RcsB-dependent stress response
MSEATQTPTVEQTLNKTDFGQMVFEYRKLFFGVLIAILVGATGYVIFKESKKSSALSTSVEVFEFQKEAWDKAKANKMTPAELLAAFNKLDVETKTAPVMIPLALEMGKFLFEKNALEEANSILSQVSSGTSGQIASFFLGMQQVTILEKLGKHDEAISVLEKLAQNKEVLMAPKVSLELGRLYLAKGEKGKAQSQFDYILNTFPNDEQAKMAKIYLSKLAQ